jgi:hypothetical protein
MNARRVANEYNIDRLSCSRLMAEAGTAQRPPAGIPRSIERSDPAAVVAYSC